MKRIKDAFSEMITSAAELVSPVGLVAGNGSFPLEFARSAKQKNLKVVAVAHKGETDPELESLVASCEWLKVGQLGKLIRALQRQGVKQVAFAGGIKKARLFKDISLDLRAIALLAKLKVFGDDKLLRAIAAELERSGIGVFSASLVLDKLLAPRGLLATRDLSPSERSDALVGWRAAKSIGELDIGQTVCVVRGVVTAVEALEGTDMAIRRSFELVGSAGVVVKTCKPNQDQRMDLPAIGPNTIESLASAKATALIIEAGKTLMFEPELVRQSAQKNSIAILGAESEIDLRE